MSKTEEKKSKVCDVQEQPGGDFDPIRVDGSVPLLFAGIENIDVLHSQTLGPGVYKIQLVFLAWYKILPLNATQSMEFLYLPSAVFAQ